VHRESGGRVGIALMWTLRIVQCERVIDREVSIAQASYKVLGMRML